MIILVVIVIIIAMMMMTMMMMMMIPPISTITIVALSAGCGDAAILLTTLPKPNLPRPDDSSDIPVLIVSSN